MSPDVRDFLILIKAIVIVLLIAAAVAAIFYHLKRRELFGGFIGAFVVAFIGALIGGYVLDYLFYDITVKILEFLSKTAGVDIIAGFIGAYIALAIMNKLNKDKERTKY